MKVPEKYDLAEVVKRLLDARSSGPSPPVTFHAFELDDVLAVLETGIEFRSEIPDIDRRSIVFKAASAIGGQVAPTAQSLVDALVAAERAYLRQRRRRFILATSIGVRPFRALRSAVIADAALQFTVGLPSRFVRTPMQREIDRVTKDAPAFLTIVRVGVNARTHMAGYDQALYALDLLRAVWNFKLNSGIGTRRTSGRSRPVNAILLGPIQTLHDRTGALATETLWYDDRSLEPSWVKDLSGEWDSVREWTAKVRGRLKRIRYQPDLESLFVRYVRACDVPEHDVSFNRLWSVLEHLVDAVGAYDRLIRRVSFLYHRADRRFTRLILEHLRDVRNGIVHLDRSRDAMETYLFQLKHPVERAFMFHLRHGTRFSSRAHASAFLDLPTDHRVLRDRMSDYKRALRMHS